MVHFDEYLIHKICGYIAFDALRLRLVWRGVGFFDRVSDLAKLRVEDLAPNAKVYLETADLFRIFNPNVIYLIYHNHNFISFHQYNYVIARFDRKPPDSLTIIGDYCKYHGTLVSYRDFNNEESIEVMIKNHDFRFFYRVGDINLTYLKKHCSKAIRTRIIGVIKRQCYSCAQRDAFAEQVKELFGDRSDEYYAAIYYCNLPDDGNHRRCRVDEYGGVYDVITVNTRPSHITKRQARKIRGRFKHSGDLPHRVLVNDRDDSVLFLNWNTIAHYCNYLSATRDRARLFFHYLTMYDDEYEHTRVSDFAEEVMEDMLEFGI